MKDRDTIGLRINTHTHTHTHTHAHTYHIFVSHEIKFLSLLISKARDTVPRGEGEIHFLVAITFAFFVSFESEISARREKDQLERVRALIA